MVEDYLENEYRGARPQQQRSRLNHWLKLIGTKQVIDITKDDNKQGLRELPKSLSNSTINKYKNVFKVHYILIKLKNIIL